MKERIISILAKIAKVGLSLVGITISLIAVYNIFSDHWKALTIVLLPILLSCASIFFVWKYKLSKEVNLQSRKEEVLNALKSKYQTGQTKEA